MKPPICDYKNDNMAKILSSEFSMNRYGLHARLVNEDDTDYILSLRTNKKLTKFLHPTENSRQKQLEWLTNYKVSEREGRDYYFIYEKDGKPIGINRIYDINKYYGTIGSWICSPDNEAETSMATYFFMLDIFFKILDLDMAVFEVSRGNEHVAKLHKMAGAQQIGENSKEYHFIMLKQVYLSHNDKLLDLLNLK